MPGGGHAPFDRSALVPLPIGLWTDDGPVREFRLRVVEGMDEAFLIEATDLTPQARASALLARCLAPAADQPPLIDLVGRLVVGDREALLLHLRRMTLGDRLECVITCPDEMCAERLEVELAVDDLLVEAAGDLGPEYTTVVGTGARALEVAFRLPTVGDVDAVTEVAGTDPERAAADLLRRCLRQVTRRGRTVHPDRLGDAEREAITTAMAERDPQAEIELDLVCPNCSTTFSVILDAGAFFVQELSGRATHLLEDVHALALHYHWSERDILALPRERRDRYLDLLAASLRRMTVSEPLLT